MLSTQAGHESQAKDVSRKEGYHDFFARIPEEVWKRLCQEAEEENRSATAQLISILRERYGLKAKARRKDLHR